MLATMQVLLAEGGTPVLHLIARLQRLAVEETLARNAIQGQSKPTSVFLLMVMVRRNLITSYVSSCRAAVTEECQFKSDLLIWDGTKIC